MTSQEIEKFIVGLGFQKQSYRELSQNRDGTKSLIESDMKCAYRFDDVVKYIFPNETPASADAVLFDEEWITFIEFKSGFQENETEEKNSELKTKLRLKAIESRWVLEYHIVPSVSSGETEHPEYKVRYISVVNIAKRNGADAIAFGRCQLAGNESNAKNMVQSLINSLSRLGSEQGKSRIGKPAYYDAPPDVMSPQMFFASMCYEKV